MVVGFAGYGSLWSTGAVAPAEEYSGNIPLTKFLLGLTQGHSGYFDILAGLGLVGAIVFFIFMISVTWTVIRAFASFREGEAGSALAELSGFVLLGSLVHNLTQTTFLRDSLPWLFLVLSYLLLCSVRSSTDPESSSASEPAPAPVSRTKPLSRGSRMNR